MLNHANNLCANKLRKGFIAYLDFGGLFPLPSPDLFPVVLGPFGGLGALGVFGAVVVVLDM